MKSARKTSFQFQADKVILVFNFIKRKTDMRMKHNNNDNLNVQIRELSFKPHNLIYILLLKPNANNQKSVKSVCYI